MPFQPVPNGRKVELNGVQNSIPVVNVFYVTTEDAVSEDSLNVIAFEVIDWFNAHANLFHTSYTLANVTVTDVSSADSIQVVVSPPTGGVGTSAGTAAGANVAVCASLRTSRIGRSFRGRFYFGAVNAAALSDAQHINTGAVTAYAGAITDLIDAMTAIGATLVVVSRFAAGVARVTALASQIISVILDAKVDSQRRRTAN